VRTVFLGTSEFAVAVLRRLAGSEHRPVLVLTRPDRPQGRGRRLAPPPVARAAAELGIELDQPESVNQDAARRRIELAEPEAVCVCAFGALIREPLLSSYRMLNVHPSLLPRWRGAAPIERAIMTGDEKTGVTIIQLTAGLDSGPMCLQAAEPIAPQETYGSLASRLAKLGGELLVRALSEDPPCRAQEDALATYAEKLSPADRRLDPARPAVELERVVRALTPHVGAQVELDDGLTLGVTKARAIEPGEEQASPGQSPSVIRPLRASTRGVPALPCSPGLLELLVVKPPGRREMPAQDWLRGLRR
jgi:methionyl-tRNA formyltransferase